MADQLSGTVDVGSVGRKLRRRRRVHFIIAALVIIAFIAFVGSGKNDYLQDATPEEIEGPQYPAP